MTAERKRKDITIGQVQRRSTPLQGHSGVERIGVCSWSLPQEPRTIIHYVLYRAWHLALQPHGGLLASRYAKASL